MQRKQQKQGINWAHIIEYTILGILAGIGYIIVQTIMIIIKAIFKH